MFVRVSILHPSAPLIEPCLEQNRFDKAVADGSIFTDEVIKQKELLFGEHKVIQKRLKEIITILVDEYKMPDSHAKNLVYERIREELKTEKSRRKL